MCDHADPAMSNAVDAGVPIYHSRARSPITFSTFDGTPFFRCLTKRRCVVRNFADTWPAELLLTVCFFVGALVGGPNNIISSAVAADLALHPSIAGSNRALGVRRARDSYTKRRASCVFGAGEGGVFVAEADNVVFCLLFLFSQVP